MSADFFRHSLPVKWEYFEVTIKTINPCRGDFNVFLPRCLWVYQLGTTLNEICTWGSLYYTVSWNSSFWLVYKGWFEKWISQKIMKWDSSLARISSKAWGRHTYLLTGGTCFISIVKVWYLNCNCFKPLSVYIPTSISIYHPMFPLYHTSLCVRWY